MKKVINTSHIEGYVYEHKLEKKVSGEKSKNPGTEFITGNLNIATNDELTNVITVHFTYVTEKTAKGSVNETYNILLNIIEGNIGNVMSHGIEKAGKVRIDSAIDLNEFYTKGKDGNEELVSAKRNEGGFVHLTQELTDPENRATFNTDILINNFTVKEPDEEKNLPAKGVIKGCIFTFRGDIKPVEYSVYHPGAINYFESLEISPKNPVFTRVTGQQISKTVIKQIAEESAWGEAKVREVKNTQKDFVVTWAIPETYEWDTEGVLLASELTEKITAREIYLADIKKRRDEYEASKNVGAFSNTPVATPTKVYDF